MAVREKRRSKANDEPSYSRYAFVNPYNLALLAGVGATAAATGHWWMALCGAAAEGIWMLFAPDSKVLRAVWFDKMWRDEKDEEKLARRKKKLAQLAPYQQQRFAMLYEQRRRIEQLAGENPSLTTELLVDELAKLDSLLDDFLELELVSGRCERHLGSFDFPSMERSWQLYEHQVRQLPPADERRSVAEKNLDVLRKRRDRWAQLQRTMETARGQMDLMEQTFRLLADDIVTASPGELGGRLDELRVGVDAIRETSDHDDEAQYEALAEAEDTAAREAQEEGRRAR